MTNDLLVVTAGLLLIAAIAWYFFRAPRHSAQASEGAQGVQEVAITVQGGYDPAQVRVRAGRPLRLRFDRRETNPCSEEVVIADAAIRRYLAPNQVTVIEVPPLAPGVHEFRCGMGMLHGTLVVEGDPGEDRKKMGETGIP